MTQLTLDPKQTAMIIQGTQRDLLEPDGLLSTQEIRAHVKAQNMIAHVGSIADAFRSVGSGVVHVFFVVEPGGRGTKTNAPMYLGIVEAGGVQRGAQGVQAVAALSPRAGDFVVEKARENPFYNTTLESLLRGLEVDTLVVVGALTSAGIEHTARHAADAGYRVIVPTDAIAGHNAEWHRHSLEGFLTSVATLATTNEVIAAISDERA